MAIALPAGSKIYLSLQPVDMRKGFDGLAAQVQQILARDPFSGHLFLFHGRRGQLPTFYIRFSIRDRSLSLASAVRANAAGLAVPARQGADVHLHAGAAGSVPRAAELDVRQELLRRHDARPSRGQHRRA
jgi:transposase